MKPKEEINEPIEHLEIISSNRTIKEIEKDETLTEDEKRKQIERYRPNPEEEFEYEEESEEEPEEESEEELTPEEEFEYEEESEEEPEEESEEESEEELTPEEIMEDENMKPIDKVVSLIEIGIPDDDLIQKYKFSSEIVGDGRKLLEFNKINDSTFISDEDKLDILEKLGLMNISQKYP